MQDSFSKVAHDAITVLSVLADMMEGEAGATMRERSAALEGRMSRLGERDDSWRAQNRRTWVARKRAEERDAAEPGCHDAVLDSVDVGVQRLPAQQIAPMSAQRCGKTYGNNPKRVGRARRLRLVAVDADGRPTGYVDEGTAAELANRNRISPSTIYRIAGTGTAAAGFVVERVL